MTWQRIPSSPTRPNTVQETEKGGSLLRRMTREVRTLKSLTTLPPSKDRQYPYVSMDAACLGQGNFDAATSTSATKEKQKMASTALTVAGGKMTGMIHRNDQSTNCSSDEIDSRICQNHDNGKTIYHSSSSNAHKPNGMNNTDKLKQLEQLYPSTRSTTNQSKGERSVATTVATTETPVDSEEDDMMLLPTCAETNGPHGEMNEEALDVGAVVPVVAVEKKVRVTFCQYDHLIRSNDSDSDEHYVACQPQHHHHQKQPEEEQPHEQQGGDAINDKSTGREDSPSKDDRDNKSNQDESITEDEDYKGSKDDESSSEASMDYDIFIERAEIANALVKGQKQPPPSKQRTEYTNNCNDKVDTSQQQQQAQHQHQGDEYMQHNINHDIVNAEEKKRTQPLQFPHHELQQQQQKQLSELPTHVQFRNRSPKSRQQQHHHQEEEAQHHQHETKERDLPTHVSFPVKTNEDNETLTSVEENDEDDDDDSDYDDFEESRDTFPCHLPPSRFGVGSSLNFENNQDSGDSWGVGLDSPHSSRSGNEKKTPLVPMNVQLPSLPKVKGNVVLTAPDNDGCPVKKEEGYHDNEDQGNEETVRARENTASQHPRCIDEEGEEDCSEYDSDDEEVEEITYFIPDLNPGEFVYDIDEDLGGGTVGVWTSFSEHFVPPSFKPLERPTEEELRINLSASRSSCEEEEEEEDSSDDSSNEEELREHLTKNTSSGMFSCPSTGSLALLLEGDFVDTKGWGQQSNEQLGDSVKDFTNNKNEAPPDSQANSTTAGGVGSQDNNVISGAKNLLRRASFLGGGRPDLNQLRRNDNNDMPTSETAGGRRPLARRASITAMIGGVFHRGPTQQHNENNTAKKSERELIEEKERARVFVYERRGTTGRVSEVLYCEDTVPLKSRLEATVSVEQIGSVVMENLLDSRPEFPPELEDDDDNKEDKQLDQNEQREPADKDKFSAKVELFLKEERSARMRSSKHGSCPSNISATKMNTYDECRDTQESTKEDTKKETSDPHGDRKKQDKALLGKRRSLIALSEVSSSRNLEVKRHSLQTELLAAGTLETDFDDSKKEFDDLVSEHHKIIAESKRTRKTVSKALKAIGVASPFRRTTEIIPKFGGLHHHIRSQLIRNDVDHVEVHHNKSSCKRRAEFINRFDLGEFKSLFQNLSDDESSACEGDSSVYASQSDILVETKDENSEGDKVNIDISGFLADDTDETSEKKYPSLQENSMMHPGKLSNGGIPLFPLRFCNKEDSASVLNITGEADEAQSLDGSQHGTEVDDRCIENTVKTPYSVSVPEDTTTSSDQSCSKAELPGMGKQRIEYVNQNRIENECSDDDDDSDSEGDYNAEDIDVLAAYFGMVLGIDKNRSSECVSDDAVSRAFNCFDDEHDFAAKEIERSDDVAFVANFMYWFPKNADSLNDFLRPTSLCVSNHYKFELLMTVFAQYNKQGSQRSLDSSGNISSRSLVSACSLENETNNDNEGNQEGTTEKDGEGNNEGTIENEASNTKILQEVAVPAANELLDLKKLHSTMEKLFLGKTRRVDILKPLMEQQQKIRRHSLNSIASLGDQISVFSCLSGHDDDNFSVQSDSTEEGLCSDEEKEVPGAKLQMKSIKESITSSFAVFNFQKQRVSEEECDNSLTVLGKSTENGELCATLENSDVVHNDNGGDSSTKNFVPDKEAEIISEDERKPRNTKESSESALISSSASSSKDELKGWWRKPVSRFFVNGNAQQCEENCKENCEDSIQEQKTEKRRSATFGEDEVAEFSVSITSVEDRGDLITGPLPIFLIEVIDENDDYTYTIEHSFTEFQRLYNELQEQKIKMKTAFPGQGLANLMGKWSLPQGNLNSRKVMLNAWLIEITECLAWGTIRGELRDRCVDFLWHSDKEMKYRAADESDAQKSSIKTSSGRRWGPFARKNESTELEENTSPVAAQPNPTVADYWTSKT